MPYSGADVLAQLSELARQRAEMPKIEGVLILAQSAPAGELVQSALRAVVGYETAIELVATLAGSRKPGQKAPSIAFLYDDQNDFLERFGNLMALLRRANITCPVAVISTTLPPQDYPKIIELGAIDIMHRDDICGLRLRETVLKLAPPAPA
jgi:hypothetical protein